MQTYHFAFIEHASFDIAQVTQVTDIAVAFSFRVLGGSTVRILLLWWWALRVQCVSGIYMVDLFLCEAG